MDDNSVEFTFLHKKHTYKISLFLCSIDHKPEGVLIQKSLLLLIMEDISAIISLEKLKDVSQYKNKMMASFSHELRTPLNTSNTMLTLMRPFVSSDILEQFLTPALCNNIILLNILNDILDFSQLEIGNFSYKFSEFNLYDNVLEAFDLLKPHAALKEIQYEFKYDIESLDKSLIINSDQDRLKQIITNLLNNAFKFTQQGKITLAVSRHSKF